MRSAPGVTHTSELTTMWTLLDSVSVFEIERRTVTAEKIAVNAHQGALNSFSTVIGALANQ